DSRAPGVTPNGGNSGAQLTYTGMTASSVPMFELTLPDFNLDFTGLPGDGTATKTANGSTVILSVNSLNYSVFAAWSISPFLANAPMANELGVGVSGYQTPAGGVPATGSATYLGKDTAGAGGEVDGVVIVSN